MSVTGFHTQARLQVANEQTTVVIKLSILISSTVVYSMAIFRHAWEKKQVTDIIVIIDLTVLAPLEIMKILVDNKSNYYNVVPITNKIQFCHITYPSMPSTSQLPSYILYTLRAMLKFVAVLKETVLKQLFFK